MEFASASQYSMDGENHWKPHVASTCLTPFFSGFFFPLNLPYEGGHLLILPILINKWNPLSWRVEIIGFALLACVLKSLCELDSDSLANDETVQF
jgi:hypothetical protein